MRGRVFQGAGRSRREQRTRMGASPECLENSEKVRGLEHMQVGEWGMRSKKLTAAGLLGT